MILNKINNSATNSNSSPNDITPKNNAPQNDMPKATPPKQRQQEEPIDDRFKLKLHELRQLFSEIFQSID